MTTWSDNFFTNYSPEGPPLKLRIKVGSFLLLVTEKSKFKNLSNSSFQTSFPKPLQHVGKKAQMCMGILGRRIRWSLPISNRTIRTGEKPGPRLTSSVGYTPDFSAPFQNFSKIFGHTT